MWIKALLSVVIVAFCTFLGYLAANKYRLRRDFYARFCAFNERFLNELSYARKPLTDFLRDNCGDGEFGRAVAEFREKRTVGKQPGFLTKEEAARFSDYLATLGKGSAQAQQSYFSAQREELSALKERTSAEAKTRGELYLKLGLLAGLAFVILIV